MIPTINSDAILIRLGYSSKTGETATFKIEPAAWEMLKANEGKNYALVLAEVGNDGQPTVTKPKEAKGWQCGERARWVIERCKEPLFWRFLYETYGESMTPIVSEDEAKLVVLGLYGMTSRKEFEDDSRAFNTLRRLYNDWAYAEVEKNPLAFNEGRGE